MDEITAPLGLTLPTEARVWWSRHNGGAEAPIGSYRAAAKLQDMVAQAEQARVLQQMYEDDGVYSWEDRLLPLVQSSEEIFACDCSVPDGAPSPIWLYIPKQCEDIEEAKLPFGSSLRSGSPRSTKASTSSYPTRATRSCTTIASSPGAGLTACRSPRLLDHKTPGANLQTTSRSPPGTAFAVTVTAAAPQCLPSTPVHRGRRTCTLGVAAAPAHSGNANFVPRAG
jgi:hypothetical protein